MKRKIIQIAGSTHLVSIPKKWITKRGIKKGDEVDVEEKGNKIMISTEKNPTPKKLKISAEKFGNFHPNYLSAAYHMGYEDVEIEYKKKETLEKIQKRIQNCIGYEIVNQGNNSCRIKSISHVSLNEFDHILRKTFLLLITMGDNILEVLNEGRYKRLEEVKILETTNNKLTDFCKRVLNIQGYKDHSKLTTIYNIVMYLERVADEYRDLCDALINKKNKVSSVIISNFKEVNELVKEFYESFYKFDNTKIESVFKKARPMRDKFLKQMMTAKPSERIVLHALSNISNDIYEMATANIELKI